MQLAKSIRQFFGFLILTLGLGGLLGATAAQAAECKGMSKSKCTGATACNWVKSYETSKGKTVDGYCRSKPTKDGSKKATSSTSSKEKKKSADKTTDKKAKKEKDAKKDKKEKTSADKKKSADKTKAKKEKKEKEKKKKEKEKEKKKSSSKSGESDKKK